MTATPATRGPGQDGGWVTAWTLTWIPVLMLCLGLLLDGGRYITARQQASAIADQGARTAVDQMERGGYRDGGDPRAVNAAAASAAACRWVSRHYPTARCAVQVLADGQVQVTTTLTYQPLLLSVVGVRSLTAQSTAQARPALGDRTEIDFS